MPPKIPLPSIALLVWIALFVRRTDGQIGMGQSDRSQQELALLGWTAAVRMAYCQQAQIAELVDPFREAVARMINRHCRVPTACRLKKTVTFNKHQVVLLDGYPRREHRTLHFRFFVVLPHDAVPLDKKPDKPLLSSQILAEMLDAHIGELSHGLGWQLLGHERYPRFDPATTFFNRSLIPIAILAGVCMFFLAYWTNAFTSGSSLYGGGWLVRGSSGGKNAALRRTMEIIEEQKFRFALYDAQRGVRPGAYPLVPVVAGAPAPKAVVVYKSNERVKGVQGPPKSLATSYSTPQAVEASRAMPIIPAPIERGRTPPEEPPPLVASQRQGNKAKKGPNQQQQQPQPSRDMLMKEMGQRVMSARPPQGPQPQQPELALPPGKSSFSTGSSSSRRREMEEMGDVVPEIVVMHAQSSSQEDRESGGGGGRRMSIVPEKGHRRQSRRISLTGDDYKRKKSMFGGGSKDSQAERQKRFGTWKASSLVLSKLGGRKSAAGTGNL